MPADGFDLNGPTSPRLPTAAPASTAPLAEREAWAAEFVPSFLCQTGGDPEIEGVPAGRRWRQEYFECVRDPQAFQQRADEEILAFRTKENR